MDILHDQSLTAIVGNSNGLTKSHGMERFRDDKKNELLRDRGSQSIFPSHQINLSA